MDSKYTSKQDITQKMQAIGRAAKDCAHVLANTSATVKQQALQEIARAMDAKLALILDANQKDLEKATKQGHSKAFLDRLLLNKERIKAMTAGVNAIAKLEDPVGKILARWKQPTNDLIISRVSVPLGVIGIIYESRPNVTADAAALCLKAGNTAILRGGSESFHTVSAIMAAIQIGLNQVGLPQECVQMVPITDRKAVTEMLKMDQYIDVIIPRGGKSLIKKVTQESQIPLFKHLHGICHTYIQEDAELNMAIKVVLNAKMRRPGICGATETLLIDKSIAKQVLPPIVDELLANHCELRGDSATLAIDKRIKPADQTDWDTEYLDAILSIKIVANLDEAVVHIRMHGSGHTDAIITSNSVAAEKFLHEIDSAIAMHNCSTQFADGGEFGMGAEIGISTGKLHARGPVGIEQLTTFKYIVRGHGQIRGT